MGMISFYWMLIFVMVVWMAIKVGRGSTGMGILTFLCWPIAVIPLITNWGQRDSDIRLQFLVTVIATALLWNAAMDAALEQQRFEQELAQASGDESLYAMQIEAERDGVRYGRPAGNPRAPLIALDAAGNPVAPTTSGDMAYYLRATGRVGGPAAAGTLNRSNVATAPGAPGGAQPAMLAPSPESELEFAPALARVHATPLREIRFRRGDVHLSPAFASIEVPKHFRFVARHQLGLLSELRDIPVGEQTLGWIVHERVNLNSAHFWFVEVQFHEVGHLEAPTPAMAPGALEWNGDRMVAQWSQPPAEAARGEDVLAAKLLRHGVLLFRVPELKPDERELGVRAARLLASRVQADTGWAHADFVGETSAQTLAAWVQSRQAGAEATVTAEAEGERERSS